MSLRLRLTYLTSIVSLHFKLRQIHIHQTHKAAKAHDDQDEGQQDLSAQRFFGNGMWIVHHITFDANIYSIDYNIIIHYDNF